MSVSPDVDDGDDGDGDDDGEWRFSLDDLGDDDDGSDEPVIEPEDVDLENVVFVLVGVVGALALLLSAL